MTSLIPPRASLLELVPDSWLLATINMLPARDKLSLFQVSRHLTSSVLQCAVKVRATFSHDSDRQLTDVEAGARRAILARLLHDCHSFEAVAIFKNQSPLPFPTPVSSRITRLKACWHPKSGPSSVCIDWHALSNLSELVFSVCRGSEQDISRLCDALEAGHLQSLQKVSFELRGAALPNTIIERLARALGPQLTALTIDVPALLAHLAYFTLLQVLCVECCNLTTDHVQHMCQHPKLRTVQVGVNIWVEGDQRQRTCNWGMLKVSGLAFNRLALPLAGVQQICVVGGWRGWIEPTREVTRSLLAQHVNKMICEPCQRGTGLPVFELWHVCEDVSPLLARLQVACNLTLMYEPEHGRVVHAIWKALPACVQVITLLFVHKLDWVHLWQDLPHHVHTMELAGCNVPVSDLSVLVRTAPGHISKLVLRRGRDEPHTDYAKWDATHLHECAPSHLSLQIR